MASNVQARDLGSGTGPAARVLIVDDSAVARAVIGRVVASNNRFAIVGAVANVAAALAFLAQASVDIILLDIQMPGVDGLTAMPDLIAASRGAKVLIVSSSADEGAAVTVQALALGAAETLVKPEAGTLSTSFGQNLLEKLSRLSERPEPVTPKLPTNTAQRLGAAADAYDIVAIGASTGGIHALGHLLRALPPSFNLPVLITQHLPSSFMPYFAAQLAVLASRPCEVATDRLRVRAGRLIVAPGDAHMRCVRIGDGETAIRTSQERVANGCLPSVDPMFASLADVYGPRVLAIVLSGMGRDGSEGARRISQAGGCVVVQDQASSVVWGMPGAVAGQGIADAILSPEEIGLLAAARRRP